MKTLSTPAGAPQLVLHIEHDFPAAILVRQVLAGVPHLRHAGHAITGREGIELCRRLNPAVALVGLALPDVDAFAVVAELARLPRPPKILIFAALAGEAMPFLIGRSGADGVIWKTSGAPRELLDAVQTVLDGRTYFPPAFHEAARAVRRQPDSFSKFLSDREVELVPLLGRGLSDAEVAGRLGISTATAHSHRQRIMAKLGLHSTAGLMRWAAEKGFVHVGLPAAPCCLAG